LIHYIKGIVTQTMPGMVIVENNGIGYEINVPDNSGVYITANDTVTLYTSMIVREDDISLYGFLDTQSLAMFNLLMTVSGVGAKGALAVLTALNVSELKRAICFEDVASVTKANGIGKKIAQRIVLELKDKVGMPDEIPQGSAAPKITKGSNKDQALAALVALGYSKSEAMLSLTGINDENLTTEEYIKLALRSGR